MSASAELQLAITTLLGTAGALRVAVPIVARRTKDLGAEIEAAAANKGLCLYVLPPLPQSAQDDVPFVFFDRADIRVRVIEKLAVNVSGASAFELLGDVALALHWQNPGGRLAHPLQLAGRCVEKIEDAQTRIVDVIFDAPWQLPGGPRPGPEFTPAGISSTEDLHAAVLAQLRAVGGLAATVPIVTGQPKDLAGRLDVAAAEKSGLWIEIDPPVPTAALQGVPYVFFTEAQITVRIKEVPAVNGLAADAYDLIEDVAASLHWQDFGGWLEQPLRLDANPVRETADPVRRQLDVVFNAAFQWNGDPAET